MSEYTATTSEIVAIPEPSKFDQLREPIEELVRQLSAEELALGWCSSRLLQELAQPSLGTFWSEVGKPTDVIDTAMLRAEKIAAAPMAKALFRARQPRSLMRSERLLAESRAAKLAGNQVEALRKARAADAEMRRAMAANAKPQATAERAIAVRAAELSLQEMGFTVDRHDGTQSSGLWASRGDQVVAVLAHDGGAMTMDTAGCEGNGCRPLAAGVVEGMSRHGVVSNAVHREAHADPGGGRLIARAKAAGGGPEGVVRQQEIGVPTQQTAQEEQTPKIRKRRIA